MHTLIQVDDNNMHTLIQGYIFLIEEIIAGFFYRLHKRMKKITRKIYIHILRVIFIPFCRR